MSVIWLHTLNFADVSSATMDKKAKTDLDTLIYSYVLSAYHSDFEQYSGWFQISWKPLWWTTINPNSFTYNYDQN